MSAVAFFVESALATVAVGLPSQPAKGIMVTAKNSRRHLDITAVRENMRGAAIAVRQGSQPLRDVTEATGVMIVSAEYSLESEVS